MKAQTSAGLEPSSIAAQSHEAISREEILAHLTTVLEGPEFRASKRCQGFLSYIVEHTLDHPTQPLKERTIGIEALGRRPDYDTNNDGVVRIKASEVRKRLLLHYAGVGAHTTIHIALPRGSYIPTFLRIVQASSLLPSDKQTGLQNASPETAGLETADTAAIPGRPGLRIRGALLLALVLMVGAGVWRWRALPSGTVPADTVIDEFWQPLTASSAPILLATDYAPVYLPPPNTEDGKPATYTLLQDQYVGGGDLIAAVKVASLLTARRHAYTLRMGTAVTFEDLRNTPTVLIGYSSTQWSEVTRNFRYFIDDGDRGMIRDFGKATDWYPHNRGKDYHVTEDYAIVSRAFDPQTHSMLVLISGCTQYGTEGAARLVTDGDLLAGALHGAPADWPKKNMQLILRIDLVANAPATAKVIGSYYW